MELDFGSVLPFNYQNDAGPHTWRAYYMPLCDEHVLVIDGAKRLIPECWAYFVWLPPELSLPMLAKPDGWGIVPEIPHEHLYVEVRREPVYFLRPDELGQSVLVDFLLENCCEAHVIRIELLALRASLQGAVRETAWQFERLIRALRFPNGGFPNSEGPRGYRRVD